MADKKDTKTKRKGGGQPGNTNALKHGFYSRRFCDLELGDFESSLGDDLQSEVAMLRAGQRLDRGSRFAASSTLPQALTTWNRLHDC